MGLEIFVWAQSILEIDRDRWRNDDKRSSRIRRDALIGDRGYEVIRTYSQKKLSKKMMRQKNWGIVFFPGPFHRSRIP